MTDARDIEHIIHRIGRRSHNGADLDHLVTAIPALLTDLASLRKQLEDAREALRHIKIEAEREQGHWQHLKRVIAVHADEALKGKS